MLFHNFSFSNHKKSSLKNNDFCFTFSSKKSLSPPPQKKIIEKNKQVGIFTSHLPTNLNRKVPPPHLNLDTLWEQWAKIVKMQFWEEPYVDEGVLDDKIGGREFRVNWVSDPWTWNPKYDLMEVWILESTIIEPKTITCPSTVLWWSVIFRSTAFCQKWIMRASITQNWVKTQKVWCCLMTSLYFPIPQKIKNKNLSQ